MGKQCTQARPAADKAPLPFLLARSARRQSRAGRQHGQAGCLHDGKATQRLPMIALQRRLNHACSDAGGSTVPRQLHLRHSGQALAQLAKELQGGRDSSMSVNKGALDDRIDCYAYELHGQLSGQATILMSEDEAERSERLQRRHQALAPGGRWRCAHLGGIG